MSKELEALDTIEDGTMDYEYQHNDYSDYDVVDRVRVGSPYQNEIDLIRKALTPPTSDEVCKALGEYCKCPITYAHKAFWDNRGYYRVMKKYDGRIQFAFDNVAILPFIGGYPVDLLILIGRFYESEEKKK